MQHVLLPALLSFPSLRRNSSSCAKRSLFNPVFSLPGRVRDPAVRLNEAGEAELFFTYFRGNPAAMFTSAGAKDYYVSRVVTRDWQTFSEPSDITLPGFASPDAPIRWDNATIIAFQAYPDKSLGGKSSGLFFSRRDDGSEIWSEPRPFLREALTLPWNTGGRADDATQFRRHICSLRGYFFLGAPSTPHSCSTRRGGCTASLWGARSGRGAIGGGQTCSARR